MGLSASMSSISSSNSRYVGSNSINNAKSLLFTQQSPRILNLYLYIVFIVFVSFMAILSANFVIYMQKKAEVSVKV